jgi:hypothetical protein
MDSPLQLCYMQVADLQMPSQNTSLMVVSRTLNTLTHQLTPKPSLPSFLVPLLHSTLTATIPTANAKALTPKVAMPKHSSSLRARSTVLSSMMMRT